MLESEIAEIISIHSLVKRETRAVNHFEIATGNFNPLPRKEGDAGQWESRWERLRFQSTPS